MAEDDVKLRALAEAATPGDWHYLGSSTSNRDAGHRAGSSAVYLNDDDHLSFNIEDSGFGRRAVTEAAFIAAANPTAVLALLDRVQAAEAAVERCRALEPTWHRGMYGCPDDMFSRRDLFAALDGPR